MPIIGRPIVETGTWQSFSFWVQSCIFLSLYAVAEYVAIIALVLLKIRQCLSQTEM